MFLAALQGGQPLGNAGGPESSRQSPVASLLVTPRACFPAATLPCVWAICTECVSRCTEVGMHIHSDLSARTCRVEDQFGRQTAATEYCWVPSSPGSHLGIVLESSSLGIIPEA